MLTHRGPRLHALVLGLATAISACVGPTQPPRPAESSGAAAPPSSPAARAPVAPSAPATVAAPATGATPSPTPSAPASSAPTPSASAALAVAEPALGPVPRLPLVPAVNVLPAGRCHLAPYLETACQGVAPPAYALLLATTTSTRAAEIALRAGSTGELAAGYPMVLSLDDLPLADPARKGLAVVAGLFARKEHAEQYQARLSRPTELVALASPQEATARSTAPAGVTWQAHEARIASAVEIAEETPAFSADDLRKTEEALDEALGRRWVGPGEQRARRLRALATLTPRCRLPQGRVFSAPHKDLFAFLRHYAPVRCDDGAEAWVPWRATRLESVVRRSGAGARVQQVVLVECDSPTLETRIFGAESRATPLRITPPGGC